MTEDSVLKELFARAVACMENSYSPYSNHPVGSALITENGKIYAGTNVEVAHYKGLCAEASAISGMVGAGGREISQIVVVGPGEHLCTPCGDCRQRIREFANDNTEIHVFNRGGDLLKSYTMDELLPDSFGPENLQP